MTRRFLYFGLVLVLFSVSVYFLIEGGGTNWKCFIALIGFIATGVIGAKTNFGRL